MTPALGVIETLRCPECQSTNIMLQEWITKKAHPDQRTHYCNDCSFTARRWRFITRDLITLNEVL